MSSMPPRLAQLELLDGDGRIQQAWDVHAWPLSLGRALDNDIVLHEPHAAAHHARLDVDADGRLVLQALASRNGLRVEEGKARLNLAAGQQAALAPLALWHLGASTLRVRRAEDPLPDERPWAPAVGATRRRTTLALVGATFGWIAASLWLDNAPDASWEAYLPDLLALLVGMGVWVGLWGLASKLFTRRFVVLPHLRVAFGILLAVLVCDAAFALLAFVADWPWASRVRPLVSWALGAALLARHLRLVLPAQARRIPIATALVAVLGLAWTMALQWQRSDRLFAELYVATLAPPSWRLAGAQPPKALVDDLRSLEAPLRERARKAAEKDAEP